MSSPWTSWPPPTPPTSSQVKNLSAVLGATVTDALDTLGGVIGALTTTSILNVSGVVGATATAALNTLAAAIAALTTTSIANVSSVPGATATAALNTLAALITALTTTSIANVSGVAGATATAALNTLAAAIAALTTTSIANASSVPGGTATAALNSLLASRGARDPFWDPPTTPDAFDTEFNVDVLNPQTTWHIQLNGSLGVDMTRDGDLAPDTAVAAGHFRSGVRGGTLVLQLHVGDSISMWRTVPSAPSGNRLWILGFGFPSEMGTGNTSDPRTGVGFYKNAGGIPDTQNRCFVRTGSSADRYEILAVTANVTVSNVATNAFTLLPIDAMVLRINHGSAAAANASGFAARRNGNYGTVVGASSVQFNSATDKIVIDLTFNTQFQVDQTSNFAALRFLRSVNMSNGLWMLQD